MMKTILFALLISAFVAVPASAQDGASPPAATAGRLLHDANGRLLGPIYKVTPAGSSQVVMDDRLLTIPAASLTVVDGRLTTSLTKRDILKSR